MRQLERSALGYDELGSSWAGIKVFGDGVDSVNLRVEHAVTSSDGIDGVVF